jgi:hypothetical protein
MKLNLRILFNFAESAVAAVRQEMMEAEAAAESDDEIDVGIETDDIWMRVYGASSHKD